MEIFEQYILNSVAIVAALIVAALIFFMIRHAYGVRKVEIMFGRVWDETKTNELFYWIMVKQQLIDQHAPGYQLDIVDQYIELCKWRHEQYNKVELPGGRIVRTSTLN